MSHHFLVLESRTLQVVVHDQIYCSSIQAIAAVKQCAFATLFGVSFDEATK